MGDMANYFLDSHDFEDWDGPDENPSAHCRYCGAIGLQWRLTDKGWRLVSMNTGEPHRCDAYQKARQT